MKLILLICLGIYALIITIAFVIVVFEKRHQYEKRLYEYQNKTLSAQIEEMKELYTTMRGWRHDYRSHMQSIKAYLALNHIEAAKNYINQMETELKSIDIKYKTGNISVDAVLNSKLSLAEKSGIEIKCDAVLPENISILQTDLCIVLGNLIDNAIEACEKIEAQRKFLRIYLCIMKQQVYISVSNATNEKVRKSEKEFITKKKGNHGHGLKRINLIVEKYHGFINRQNEPGVFATEIMLPIKESVHS